MILHRAHPPAGPRPLHRRYRAVFVSPHLDDAVFSCGGTIAVLLREGPVLVVNVFTEAPGSVGAGDAAPDPARYEEECAAGSLAGFETVSLRETDAFLREGRYRKMSGLFGAPTAADLADVARLRRRLEEVLAGVECEALYVPLGVGGHVDHLLAHLACRGLAVGREVLYYEDSPYCFIPGAVDRRLRELGAEAPAREGWLPILARTWRRLLRTGMPMGPGVVRWAAAGVVAVSLQRLLVRHERCAPSAVAAPIAPTSLLLDITETYLLKSRTMQAYGSQFRTFFRGPSECDRLHLRHGRDLSGSEGLYERYWKLECLAASGEDQGQEGDR